MAKEQQKVIEIIDESRTLADSANGKLNAYSHYCTHVMHSKAYATCLHLIDQRKKGRLSILYADCSVAIGRKTCPAISMRKQEETAKHALFFRERVRHLGESFVEKASSLFNKITTPSNAKTTKSPVTVKDSFQPDKGGYSDAINNALKSGAKVEVKKEEPKKEVTPVAPIAGESLIEMAKRMMAQAQ